jgi:hypothetical protein
MRLNFLFLFTLFFSLVNTTVGQEKEYPPARTLGFVLPDEYDKAIIPFKVYNNLIIIDVLLNRSLPLKFVLDTGVRTTVLTEKTLSDLLNMEYARRITIPGVGGKKLVDAFVVNDVSLNIGEVEGKGHALLVLETDLLQLKNYLGVNVHGILGYELFSRFVVDIDYARRLITFYRPDNFKARKRFEKIDIEIYDTKPYIMAEAAIRENRGAFKGKFMIDSGSSHSILLDEASSDKIYTPEPNISTTLGRGLGGDIIGKVARVDRVSLSSFSFNEVITTFPERESYDISYEEDKRNGTIGGGLLSRFHVIFDYANSKIYLKKGKKFKDPFEFNLSGLIVKANGVYLRKYEIANVREHSSAEAIGLKVGDEIVKINGLEAKKYTLDEIIGKLNSKENKRVRLVIKRDRMLMNFDLRLTRLI